MKRIFTTEPGYDCRITCEHEPKGRHGICSEIWTYVVVDTDAQAALELNIFTPFYPATVELSHLSEDMRTFRGQHVALHLGYPTSRVDVLHGPTSESCKYIGTCYDAGNWSAMADLLIKQSFVNRVSDQPALWVALEKKLAELVVGCQAERLQDGDLKWRRCDCCDGGGVVERSE